LSETNPSALAKEEAQLLNASQYFLSADYADSRRLGRLFLDLSAFRFVIGKPKKNPKNLRNLRNLRIEKSSCSFNKYASTSASQSTK
jgi:hypothetical protein